MGIAGWFRSRPKDLFVWRMGCLTRAGVAGTELTEVLQLAVRELRAAASADRAGIWLLSDEDPEWLQGFVVEAGARPVPPEWARLERGLPLLEMLLASIEPVVVDLKRVPQAAALAPLARMRTAAWIPLRWDGRALGLALVACSFTRLRVAPEVLRAFADELALLLQAKISQAALARKEAELSSLLDSGEDAVLLADLSGRVRRANARFVEFFGLAEGTDAASRFQTLEALAEQLEENILPASAAHRSRSAPVMSHWRHFRASEETIEEELELVRPERRNLVRRACLVRDAAGRLVAWLEIFRDVTGQRRLHAQLQQAERLASLGQLVSGIAHELNNPLTSIMGYAQLLLGGRRVGNSRRAGADLHRIHQEAQRARHIVQNLLLFSRDARPERRPVDLNEIVERTVALRSYELKVENIRLEQELAPGLPRVLADPHQIQQVLLNLIVNAEQAIRQGRPFEPAHGRTEGSTEGDGRGLIHVRSRATTAGRVAVEVSDNGPGIPSGAEARIFEPFFTTKPLGQGTGLGLSIAQGIVVEHGGSISISSGRGPGATFVVELPVVTAGQLNAASRAAVVPLPVPEGASRRAPKKARVLVVEDEPTVAQLVADVLTDEGHQVDSVLDSQEGLRRALGNGYDLLICDMRMPRLDGRMLYEELLRAGSPVAAGGMIFITGDTLAPRTLDFLERHALPYVAKPFLVEELKAVVNRVLEAKSATLPRRRDAS